MNSPRLFDFSALRLRNRSHRHVDFNASSKHTSNRGLFLSRDFCNSVTGASFPGAEMKPGEYFLDEAAGPIQANAGRDTIRLLIKNMGDRPVQVGSHFHFFEVNRALEFDHVRAYGMRLNIPAGTAVRFEPGEEKEIELTPIGGLRVVRGFNGLVDGALDAAGACERAVENARDARFCLDAREKSR